MNVDLPLKMQAQTLHLVMPGVCIKIIMFNYLRLETLMGQRVPQPSSKLQCQISGGKESSLEPFQQTFQHLYSIPPLPGHLAILLTNQSQLPLVLCELRRDLPKPAAVVLL